MSIPVENRAVPASWLPILNPTGLLLLSPPPPLWEEEEEEGAGGGEEEGKEEAVPVGRRGEGGGMLKAEEENADISARHNEACRQKVREMLERRVFQWPPAVF
jgi:hypothetical protein